jgi:hypothetical protein
MQQTATAVTWVRRAAVAGFLVVFVGLQAAVPLLALDHRGWSYLAGVDLREAHDGQMYFAWQMFSRIPRPATYELRVGDRTEEVDAIDVVGRLRARQFWSDPVHDRLCELHPWADEVRWNAGPWRACP